MVIFHVKFTINRIFADQKPRLTDYNLLCKQICESSDRIVGVWTFGLDNLIASYVRPSFTEPDRTEQEKMFIQAQIVQSIVSSNEGTYGKVKHIKVSFEYFDAFLFPRGWGSGKNDEKTIISIGCIQPYSTETIVSTIEKIIIAAG